MLAAVRAHIFRVRSVELWSSDLQPRPVPATVQRGSVLGRHRNLSHSVNQQESSAAQEIYQDCSIVSPSHTNSSHINLSREPSCYSCCIFQKAS